MHLHIEESYFNFLSFSTQNILKSDRVGIIFEIPGNSHTLRVGGRATITRDPEILQRLAARGKDATMAIHVVVEYAFFHCSKA